MSFMEPIMRNGATVYHHIVISKHKWDPVQISQLSTTQCWPIANSGHTTVKEIFISRRISTSIQIFYYCFNQSGKKHLLRERNSFGHPEDSHA